MTTAGRGNRLVAAGCGYIGGNYQGERCRFSGYNGLRISTTKVAVSMAGLQHVNIE